MALRSIKSSHKQLWPVSSRQPDWQGRTNHVRTVCRVTSFKSALDIYVPEGFYLEDMLAAHKKPVPNKTLLYCSTQRLEAVLKVTSLPYKNLVVEDGKVHMRSGRHCLGIESDLGGDWGTTVFSAYFDLPRGHWNIHVIGISGLQYDSLLEENDKRLRDPTQWYAPHQDTQNIHSVHWNHGVPTDSTSLYVQYWAKYGGEFSSKEDQ